MKARSDVSGRPFGIGIKGNGGVSTRFLHLRQSVLLADGPLDVERRRAVRDLVRHLVVAKGLHGVPAVGTTALIFGQLEGRRYDFQRG